jgi:ankyrin repeat protein
MPNDQSNTTAVTEWLRKFDLDINLKDENGLTPLLTCVTEHSYDPVDTITALLRLGADPNSISNKGRSVFTALKQNKRVAANLRLNSLKALLSYNFDVTLLLPNDLEAEFLPEIKLAIIRHDIAMFYLFGKLFNQTNKQKMKIKNAQSML